MLEFPLANSTRAFLMRLMALPYAYPRESESKYFATRYRSDAIISVSRSLHFF